MNQKPMCIAGFLFLCIVPLSQAVNPPKPLLPIPSPQQLAWQQLESIGFVHFGINTFTNREWGEGREDPALFNPTELVARQWVRVFKDAGLQLLILTAKHHDGFCLWPSAYTDHSVRNSPWRNGSGDVVKEVAEACREGGIRFGVYLSPWDRNQPTYGDSPRYNEYFMNQLRELLTNYGDIAEVWFDGANGEGPNGKRQEYDWVGIYSTVRRYQPDAVIAIMGPDVRWVGNESGVARETEWSVQRVPETDLLPPQFAFNRTLTRGPLACLDEQPTSAQGLLAWYPAECDVSIRPGWFYHAKQDEEVKSFDQLWSIYEQSVGRNSVLLLNIPPDQRGLIHENDARRLQEWGRAIRETFQDDLAAGARARASQVRGRSKAYAPSLAVDSDPNTYWAVDDDVTETWLELDLGAAKTFNFAVIQEPITLGQRIAQFKLEAWQGGQWQVLSRGTTIGYKRILHFDPVRCKKVRLTFEKSRACPLIHTFSLYHAPDMKSE